jgi:hypothetical protein
MPGIAAAGLHVQTDWSGGLGEPGPVPEWSDRFADAVQVSWRSVAGQLVITSVPAVPSGDFVTDDATLCTSVASGDLDGDGDIDLMTALPLTSFPGTGKVRWYENAGDGETWTEHEVDDDFYGGKAVTAADLDGDEDLDIVASAFYDFDPNDRNGRYVWYENVDGQAGAWIKHFIAGNFWGTEMVATADIDEDGDLDVYGASTLTYIGNTNDDIYWFENLDGEGGSWTQHTIDDDFPDAIEAAVADVDGDSDLDVVCVAYGTHDLAWWENSDGSGINWVKHLITDFTLVDGAIAVEDLDEDGDVDIAAAGFNAAVAGWYENLDGEGGNWDAHTVGSLGGGTAIEIADLDGDGLLDVLASGTDLYNSQVVWFRNLGGAAAWVRYVVNTGHDQGEAAIPADLDGDGALEVVFTEEGGTGDISGIHWRRITSFRSSGELESEVLDAGGSTTWTTIDWEATSPPGTALALQVRSSNDPDDLGPWSADITEPGTLLGILDPDTRYVQYKVILSSTDPDVSPKVTEVLLEESSPSSTPGDGPHHELPAATEAAAILLEAPRPNPASESSTVSLILQSASRVRLDILDVGGRRVSTPFSGELGAGRHQVELPRLSPGAYFIRLSSGGTSKARKLVIR